MGGQGLDGWGQGLDGWGQSHDGGSPPVHSLCPFLCESGVKTRCKIPDVPKNALIFKLERKVSPQ